VVDPRLRAYVVTGRLDQRVGSLAELALGTASA
jgi:hypothetical protein